MLFNFTLKNIAECMLPENNGASNITWFWLTDSFYHVNAGGIKLFELSSEWLAKYNSARYDDYYYIRFLEDFFDILPEVNTSVPEDIYSCISTPEKRLALLDTAKAWRDSLPDPSGTEEDMYYSMYELAWYGMMDTAYLAYKSIYSFNLVGNEICIQYDFEDKTEEGIPVWLAGTGEYSMPYPIFISEIENLLARFFTSMETQIKQAMLLSTDSRYTFYDDAGTSRLEQEQKERRDFFYSNLAAIKTGNTKKTDWEKFRQGISLLDMY